LAGLGSADSLPFEGGKTSRRPQQRSNIDIHTRDGNERGREAKPWLCDCCCSGVSFATTGRRRKRDREIEEGTVEEALTFGRLFPVYFLEKFTFKGKKEDINRFYETSSGAGAVIRYT
jgi:hypothetical protein